MSQNDQIRWDRQYRLARADKKPAAFAQEILNSPIWEITPGAALDVACGSGANALLLAEKGFRVTAVDISAMALDYGAQQAKERSLSISWQQADLERYSLSPHDYDLILNINYLQRSLISPIKAALKPRGLIIFDTYLIDQKWLGHLKNPDYLLGHNELLDWFRDFRVLYYREGRCLVDGQASFRAGLFAQKLC